MYSFNFNYSAIGGYNGNSMSNRAVEAYECGKMPKSKWTKEIILNKIDEVNKELVEPASKLTKKQLFDLFCYCSEWHHTSSAYNKTDFYDFDYDLAETFKIKDLPKREVKKKEKDNSLNLYVTSYVEYKVSVRGKGCWTSKRVREIVKYRSKDKMCKTSNGNKRISCMYIYGSIEQKTRWNDGKRLEKKYKEYI